MEKKELFENLVRVITDGLKRDFEFLDDSDFSYDNGSSSIIAVRKRNVILYYEINPLEDPQLNVKDIVSETNASIMTILTRLFGRFTPERKAYFAERKKEALIFEEGSSNYYRAAFEKDIQLLLEEFPEIFQDGKFPDSLL